MPFSANKLWQLLQHRQTPQTGLIGLQENSSLASNMATELLYSKVIHMHCLLTFKWDQIYTVLEGGMSYADCAAVFKALP